MYLYSVQSANYKISVIKHFSICISDAISKRSAYTRETSGFHFGQIPQPSTAPH